MPKLITALFCIWYILATHIFFAMDTSGSNPYLSQDASVIEQQWQSIQQKLRIAGSLVSSALLLNCCKTNIDTFSHLYRHIDSQHKTNNNLYLCPQCYTPFQTSIQAAVCYLACFDKDLNCPCCEADCPNYEKLILHLTQCPHVPPSGKQSLVTINENHQECGWAQELEKSRLLQQWEQYEQPAVHGDKRTIKALIHEHS